MIVTPFDTQFANTNNKDGVGAVGNALSPDKIESLQDPTGGANSIEIASVPTPWGRMELCRAALEAVAKRRGAKKGDREEKLVSDLLDVAQIFYSLERQRQNGLIQTTHFDIDHELATLQESRHTGHQDLGQTLNTFKRQDAKFFNFNKLKEIFIITFRHPQTGDSTVLGATSPLTLFFPAPGDLTIASEYISFGKDHPFDEERLQIWERDTDFVIWFYALARHASSVGHDLTDLEAYLEASRSLLPSDTQKQINNLETNSYTQDYNILEHQSGISLSILPDVDIRGEKGRESIIQKSDFIINSIKNVQGLPPLVLPNGGGYSRMRYTTDNWDAHTQVPNVCNTPLSQRILPDDGTLYPYLGIDDLLEEKIIKLDNAIDAANFYPGELGRNIEKISPEERHGWMLPLKPMIFDYFSPEEICDQKMITVDQLASGIQVKLRIPVSGGTITYERVYNEAQDISTHSYLQDNFNMALLRTPSYSYLCYNTEDTNIKLEYLSPKTEGWQTPQVNYHDPIEGVYHTKINGTDPTALRISTKANSGVLLPLPLPLVKNMNKRVNYSIDLGTTNSSISFRIDEEQTHPLKWSKELRLIRMLTLGNKYSRFNLRFNRIMLQEHLGEADSKYHFPMRTALQRYQAANRSLGAYLSSSPALDYLIEPHPPGFTIATNIKWSANDRSLLTDYIQGICVLLNLHAQSIGARIGKISYLYPSSMNRNNLSQLNKEWRSAVDTLIKTNNPQVELGSVNESIAPYFYYQRTSGISGRSIAIDIGGETVDVLYTPDRDGLPFKSTSFRLGGNTVFSAPYNEESNGSGMSNMVLEYLKSKLDQYPSLSKEIGSMEEEIRNLKPQEAIEHFFSIPKKYSNDIKAEDRDFHLDHICQMDTIGQNHMRSLILLYFSLQLYHIIDLSGQFIDQGDKGFDNIVFSGNGSRLLDILGGTDFVQDLVKHIAQETKVKGQFRIVRNPEPKLSTSFGPLWSEAIPSPESLARSPYPKSVTDTKAMGLDHLAEVDLEQHEKEVIEDVLADVSHFTEIFASMISKLSLVRQWNFSQDSLEYISCALKDEPEMRKTLQYKIDELKRQDLNLSEYPLFMLMTEYIRIIGLKLWQQLGKNGI